MFRTPSPKRELLGIMCLLAIVILPCPAYAEPSVLDRVLSPYPETLSIRGAYVAAQKEFNAAYGESAVDDIAFAQAMRFFNVRPWLENRKLAELGLYSFNSDAVCRMMGIRRPEVKGLCVFSGADGGVIVFGIL